MVEVGVVVGVGVGVAVAVGVVVGVVVAVGVVVGVGGKMKTDEQLRDELAEKAVRGKNGQFCTMADWDAADLWKQGWDAARANPPRVEGFPEREVHEAAIDRGFDSNSATAHQAFEAGASWMYARMSQSIAGGSGNKTEPAVTQPTPDERKGDAWLLEASGDGQRDSKVVFGGIEEIKRGMAELMFFGTYEEALEDEGVVGYLERLEDVESNWSSDGEVWEEGGEQCWFRVSKIPEFQAPAEPVYSVDLAEPGGDKLILCAHYPNGSVKFYELRAHPPRERPAWPESITNTGWPHEKALRDRIEELEKEIARLKAEPTKRCACGKCHCSICGNPMELQPTRERVAELVGAMKSLINEASGLITAHEMALSMDGGNTNMKCLQQRIDEAKQALAKLGEGN